MTGKDAEIERLKHERQLAVDQHNWLHREKTRLEAALLRIAKHPDARDSVKSIAYGALPAGADVGVGSEIE